MKVIERIAITTGEIVSSDIALPSTLETGYADWDGEYSSGTAYPADAYVMVTGTAGGAATATYKVYKSVQGANTGNDPTTDDGTWWTDEGTLNQLRMFNDIIQEQSTQVSPVTVRITPGSLFTAVGLVNVDAAEVQIKVIDPTEGDVFDETISLVSDSGIADWYAYFYESIVRKDNYVNLDLPNYSSADLEITLTGTGNISLGALVVGQAITLGDTQYGLGLGLIDYSTKTVDSETGFVTITQGSYQDTMDAEIVMNTTYVSQAKKVLTDLRASPALYVADADKDGTILFGYFREFDLLFTGPVKSTALLQIESLT